MNNIDCAAILIGRLEAKRSFEKEDLVKLRQELGFSKVKMAKLLGVTKNHYWRLESEEMDDSKICAWHVQILKVLAFVNESIKRPECAAEIV